MVFDRLKNFMPSQGPALPHPEEPRNPAATLANINVNAVITQWLTTWEVPKAWWNHWRTVLDIQVYDVYPASIIAMGITQDNPAATWDEGGKRHLAVKPQWLNPGVIAHEQAHTCYSYLNPEQKAAFAAQHASLKNSDPMIRHLYSVNTYGLTNDVEGHAEIYRYIGQQMPGQLKQYYPTLF